MKEVKIEIADKEQCRYYAIYDMIESHKNPSVLLANRVAK